MNDYYSLYTWAMDKQAHLEREASQRRLARHARYMTTHNNARPRWPFARRRDDERKVARALPPQGPGSALTKFSPSDVAEALRQQARARVARPGHAGLL